MTKEEFEQGYAERSGVTVEWLHVHGQQAFPCDCGDAICMGWQMVSNNVIRVETDKDIWPGVTEPNQILELERLTGYLGDCFHEGMTEGPCSSEE